jgi:hypothetical protein
MAAMEEESAEELGPVEQRRELTATEIRIQASWHGAVEELKTRNPGYLRHIPVPDVIFEDGEVYLIDKNTFSAYGIPPEIIDDLYEELEQLFDDVVLNQFDQYRLTPEFVESVTAELWRNTRHIVPLIIGRPDSTKPFIDIMNKEEITEKIPEDDLYNERICLKVAAIVNHYNSQFIEYDIILYINTHGIIVGSLETLPLMDIPDIDVTFLAYAQLGERGYVGARLYKRIHELFDKTNVTGLDINKIIRHLRSDKFNISAKEKGINKKAHGEHYTRQLQSEGWYISTQWLERHYIPEQDPYGVSGDVPWVSPGRPYTPIEVLYDSSHDSRMRWRDIFTELANGKPFVTRSEIIKFLKRYGYKRPLIVDTSCAETDNPRHTTKDLRDLRAARRALLAIPGLREGTSGGKRSKHRRIKRKQTRRKRRKSNYK